MVDVIIYNGIKFRRYPNSRHYNGRNYYTPHIEDTRKGVQSLHREIYKAHHGSIPKGHHIHHKDGNPNNNSIENLECISHEEHTRIHMAEYYKSSEAREKASKNCKKNSVKMREWTKTPKGIEFLKRNWEKTFGDWGKKPRLCVICKKEFLSSSYRLKNLSCSPECYLVRRRSVRKKALAKGIG